MLTRFAVAAALLAAIWLPAAAQGAAPLRTGFAAWRAADGGFASWERSGVELTGSEELRAEGEAIGPIVVTGFPAAEAIPSWNADTPAGSWIEVALRARIGERWTAWYALGEWSQTDLAHRHSVAAQRDADGTVATDTLQLVHGNADGLQMRLRLHGDAVVRNAAIAFSTAPTAPEVVSAGDPSRWRGALPVPACSQMVYPDGGRAWCSPTSTSMVLGYWERDAGPCEPRVRTAVAGVFDPVYRGHGNWPFNVAYAATRGFDGYVARFASLAELEPWLAAGVPAVFSFAWRDGELVGAPQASVSGHLAVLVGFDERGNAIVHDPAAWGDPAVPRTYDRAQLERLWLTRGGGTVYLIYPPDRHYLWNASGPIR